MAEVIIRGARLAFPDLFQARQFDGSGPFTYGCTLLVDPKSEDHKKIVAAIQAVAKERWSDKFETVLKGIKDNNQKICYYPGDTKDYDGFAGMYALSTKRQQEAGKPKVVDQKRQDLTPADGKPYGGCYVNAKVDIWAQDNKWGKAVRCTLHAIQFVKDGDAFTATGPANIDGFNDEEGGDEDLI